MTYEWDKRRRQVLGLERMNGVPDYGEASTKIRFTAKRKNETDHHLKEGGFFVLGTLKKKGVDYTVSTGN